MQKTYRIKKILNNNVVVAVNNFQEVIIVGLGIGFNAKVNQKTDPRKIEKIFELKQEDAIRATQLVKDIPESMFF
ncbi:MAG: CAT RNA binding domain-containing protein [Erysipelothrix sp.]